MLHLDLNTQAYDAKEKLDNVLNAALANNVSGIYNPYSVLLTMSKQEFGSYWFETGTPSYLVYLLHPPIQSQ